MPTVPEYAVPRVKAALQSAFKIAGRRKPVPQAKSMTSTPQPIQIDVRRLRPCDIREYDFGPPQQRVGSEGPPDVQKLAEQRAAERAAFREQYQMMSAAQARNAYLHDPIFRQKLDAVIQEGEL